MNRDEEVDKNAKKNDANFFVVGPTREIPSRQDGPFSPARVANQNKGLSLSCPLADNAI